jgi:alkyl hydroperoxide reductase subunit AhpC
MPSVQRAHDQLKNQNVIFLIVSVDNSRTPVEAYLKENSYTIPTPLDSKLEVASKFGVVGTPTTFIINKQARIVASSYGPLDFDRSEFRNYLTALAK